MIHMIVANVERRRARTAMTAAGIAVGVAAVVALLALSSGLNASAGQLVHLGRADLGVFQSGAADPTSSELPLSMQGQLDRTHGIQSAAPIQLLVGAVPKSPGAVVLGIEQDSFVGRLLVWEHGHFPRAGELAIGDTLAAQLHLHTGMTLAVSGHRLRIAGVYHAGILEEDTGAIGSLREVQILTGRPTDEVTTYAVRLTPTTSAAAADRILKRDFPDLLVISDPSEAVRAGVNNELIAKAVLLIVVLALIIGALSVANTMLAAVLERSRELALLSTIGWSARQLGTLVLGEAVLVSVLGTGVGLVLGVLASRLLPAALGLGAFISPLLTAWGLGRAVLIGVAIGVGGAVYPVWRVTQIRSSSALAQR